MLLDDIILNESRINHGIPLWRNSFLAWDDEETASCSKRMAAKLLLLELQALGEDEATRNGVFLNFQARLEQLSFQSWHPVDTGEFIKILKAYMAQIVPSMKAALRHADISDWMSAYVRLAPSLPHHLRARLQEVGVEDECLGWWSTPVVGAATVVGRIKRLWSKHVAPDKSAVFAALSSVEELRLVLLHSPVGVVDNKKVPAASSLS